MKIGRNELCPCGSGLKFKKCHLFVISVGKQIKDPTQLRESFESAELKGAFSKTFPSFKGKCILEGDTGQDVIVQWQINIEAEMKDILARHSKLYWLLITRSALSSQYAKLLPYVNTKKQIHRLYVLLTIVTLKCGTTDFTDVEETRINDASGIERIVYAQNRDKDDWLNLAKLAELAVWYNLLGNFAGNMAWGQRFHVFDYCTYLGEPLNESKRTLSQLFFDRMDRDPSLSGATGLLDYRAKMNDPSEGGDELYFLLAEPRAPSDVLRETGRDTLFTIITKHLGLSASHLRYCNQTFKDAFDLSPHDFIQFLHFATVQMGFLGSNTERLGSDALWQRGMKVMPMEKWFLWMEELLEKAGAVSKNEKQKTLLEQFTAKFSRDFIETSDLSLSRPQAWPPAFLYRFGNTMVLDLLMVPNCIENILRRVLVPNRDLRGDVIAEPEFQNFILGVLDQEKVSYTHIKTPSGKAPPWKANDRIVGQIDFAIQMGPVLFAIDIKSFAAAENYISGSKRALLSRWQRIKQELEKNDQRSERLAQNPLGLNYRLAPDTRYIVSLLCTALPEPILEQSSKWFLNADTPRVVTPLELARLLLSLGKDQKELQDFVQKLYRPSAFTVKWE